MENHDTHIVSEQSKEEHGYKYDNFGNVIVDSIDDLIYDKFVDIRQKTKETETKDFIKNIINKDEFPPVTPKKEENKENTENEQDETEEKNEKKKSLININIISKGENVESDGGGDDGKKKKKDKNSKKKRSKSKSDKKKG